eukprot:1095346-Amphidinium_carterae.1
MTPSSAFAPCAAVAGGGAVALTPWSGNWLDAASGCGFVTACGNAAGADGRGGCVVGGLSGSSGDAWPNAAGKGVACGVRGCLAAVCAGDVAPVNGAEGGPGSGGGPGVCKGVGIDGVLANGAIGACWPVEALPAHVAGPRNAFKAASSCWELMLAIIQQGASGVWSTLRQRPLSAVIRCLGNAWMGSIHCMH